MGIELKGLWRMGPGRSSLSVMFVLIVVGCGIVVMCRKVFMVKVVCCDGRLVLEAGSIGWFCLLVGCISSVMDGWMDGC